MGEQGLEGGSPAPRSPRPKGPLGQAAGWVPGEPWGCR